MFQGKKIGNIDFEFGWIRFMAGQSFKIETVSINDLKANYPVTIRARFSDTRGSMVA